MRLAPLDPADVDRRQDHDVATPQEVIGDTRGPDPFRIRTEREQLALCCGGRPPRPGDVTFL